MAGAVEGGQGLARRGGREDEGKEVIVVVGVTPKMVLLVLVEVSLFISLLSVMVIAVEVEGVITNGASAVFSNESQAAPIANAEVRASRCSGLVKGGSAMENPPMTPRPRSRSVLTGRFDWTRSVLTGTFDWEWSSLTGRFDWPRSRSVLTGRFDWEWSSLTGRFDWAGGMFD